MCNYAVNNFVILSLNCHGKYFFIPIVLVIFILYKLELEQITNNMNILNKTKEKYTVYMTCPAFPGMIKASTVEAANMWDAKELALSLYPGYQLLQALPNC